MKSGSHNQHARLAPSDSARWVYCTATIAATETCVNEDSVFADEGTKAHDYAAEILNGGGPDMTEDFRLPVLEYVNHVRGIHERYPLSDPYVEESVPLFYVKAEYVTCDWALITDGRIFVRDYKHGAGYKVYALENTQLAIYAMSFVELQIDLGLYNFADDTVIDMGIVQPRHREGEKVSTWVVTLAELREFCKDITRSVEIIRSGVGTEFSPGDKACRWCPKAWKVRCPARIESLVVPGFDFDDLAHLPPLTKEEKKMKPSDRHPFTGAFSDEQLVALWANGPRITQLIDDIGSVLYARALAGDDVEGRVKLVAGRQGNREWSDPVAAEKLIRQRLKGEERWTRKLISPSRAAELIDLDSQSPRFRNLFESLVVRSDGKPTLALASDRRDAITSDLKHLDFDTDDED